MSWTDRISMLVAAGAVVATLAIGTCSTNARLNDVNGRLDDVNGRIDDLQANIRELRGLVRELRSLAIEAIKNGRRDGDDLRP